MRGLAARRRALTGAVLAIGVLTAVGVAVVYPYGGPPTAEQQDFAAVDEERIGGEITAVEVAATQDTEFLLPGAVEVVVDVATDDGRDLSIPMVDETGVLEVGKAVVVAQIGAPGTAEQYAIVDFQRGPPLTALVVAFALAVVALGRWQGVRALVGLGASAVLVVGVAVPALLAGRNPTLVAVVVALAVMCVTLPLSHGVSMTTRAAAVGTAGALLVTIGLALVAVEVTTLTGLSSEDVQLVRFATGTELDVRGLLLAGIIVGTLGVLDDVTVSQASTVAALRRADPGASDRAVFAAALRVGRDHIAATVNTLFLAYAGAALPLLILFSVGGGAVGETLTSELVAQEVVRTVVGSIGLVLAVPLTTAVAAATISAEDDPVHVHDEGVPPDEQPAAAPAGSAAPPLPDEPPPHDDDHVAWEDRLRQRYGLDDRS
ncbi:YibE/F family protein [Euzebya sp.]